MAAITGVTGFFTSFLMVLPQAIATWRCRNDFKALEDVSIWMMFLTVANALIWFNQARLVNSFWVGAPGLLNLPLALITIFLLLRVRKRKQNTIVVEMKESV